MLTLLLLVLGLGILVIGADWLVDGAAALAKRLKVTDIAIGLTVVAFGTSAPELVVNLTASFTRNTDIAIGNILGSNIANLLLILGVAGLIYPLKVKKNTVWKEIPLSLLAALTVGLMANDMLIDRLGYSALTRIDGLVMLCFFIIFLYYTYSVARSSEDEGMENAKIRDLPGWKTVAFIVSGLVLLIVGGKLVVDSAVSLALAWGISQSVIGLTIVAVGTSLPELMTSVVAAYKHKADIAIGNVVGSNIFNIFWILGISAVIHPLPFAPAANFDIIAGIAASLLLFMSMFIGRRHLLERWQAGTMLAAYGVYIAFLVTRG
jgi:cation:H+ antiporter